MVHTSLRPQKLYIFLKVFFSIFCWMHVNNAKDLINQNRWFDKTLQKICNLEGLNVGSEERNLSQVEENKRTSSLCWFTVFCLWLGVRRCGGLTVCIELYTILCRGLEHPRILVSTGGLEPIAHGNRGMTKYLKSQKCHALFKGQQCKHWMSLNFKIFNSEPL